MSTATITPPVSLTWADVAAALAANGLHASYRQIDYWTRAGIITTEPRPKETAGHFRAWPLTEIAVLAATLRLMDVGLDLRDAARYAREGYKTKRLTVRPGPGLRLEAGPALWSLTA